MLGFNKPWKNSLDRREVSRVLIVDDDVDLAVLVRRMVSIASREIQVDVAHTAAEARERLGEAHYEFVLLDNYLDGDARGIDLVSHVRRQQPGATIAMMSSMGLTKLMELTAKEKNVSILPKPFSPVLLRSFLHDALDLPGVPPAHTPNLQ